jgi:glutamate-1-semialdehyde 2,1-aminomutase
MTESKSEKLYQRAQCVMPGGVSRNTVFRRPHPLYGERGAGCRVVDVDGVQRIDFSNNMASLIHGHAYPKIVDAVCDQMQRGSAFAMATEAEVNFAEVMCARVPCFQWIRFMNSGTEAVMTAIKAARAFTGKPKIAKVEGTYHGTYDYAEVSQTSRPENWGEFDHPMSVPVAQGTPPKALEDVVVIPFNDVERAIRILDQHASEIACVLIDLLPHRVGFVPASNEFVEGLYEWTRKHSAVFVVDEVITFRNGYGGAQENYSIEPDLTAMGKMIGGGFPVGAVAGKREVMKVLDPTQTKLPFPHSGTFSANPITMIAGRIAVEDFDRAAVKRLNQLGDYTRTKIQEAIDTAGIAASVAGAGSLFRVHFKAKLPQNYRECFSNAEELKIVSTMLDHLINSGHMLINTCSGTLSTPMTEAEIDLLVDAMLAGFHKLSGRTLQETT